MMRELNLRSAIAVPLKIQDRVLGVATWVAGDEGRRFDADDLAFAENFALRAAQAIDTARLHSELSDVAVRLQRAILPAELPVLPGWQTAASYQQAGHSEAGGDFYDVTPLEDGRIALFVGDVMGRGVTAAAAMAQMRAAIRALVAVEPDPQTVLEAMDRLFDQYDFHQLVTMVYGVLDPSRDELVIANAGHPPPLVRRADGTVEVVDGEPGLLLGAGGGDRNADPGAVPGGRPAARLHRRAGGAPRRGHRDRREPAGRGVRRGGRGRPVRVAGRRGAGLPRHLPRRRRGRARDPAPRAADPARGISTRSRSIAGPAAPGLRWLGLPHII